MQGLVVDEPAQYGQSNLSTNIIKVCHGTCNFARRILDWLGYAEVLLPANPYR